MLRKFERIGNKHASYGEFSQDAIAVKTVGRYSVICLSDGASSASHSRLASTFITNDVATVLANQPLDELIQDGAQSRVADIVITQAHKTCVELCHKCNCNSEDLSATLIVVILRRSRKRKNTCALILTVGDGFVVATEGRHTHLISSGDNINGNKRLTHFVTDPKSARYVNIYRLNGFDGLLVSTDGLTHAIDVEDERELNSFVNKLRKLTTKHASYSEEVFSKVLTDHDSLRDDCSAVIYRTDT